MLGLMLKPLSIISFYEVIVASNFNSETCIASLTGTTSGAKHSPLSAKSGKSLGPKSRVKKCFFQKNKVKFFQIKILASLSGRASCVDFTGRARLPGRLEKPLLGSKHKSQGENYVETII